MSGRHRWKRHRTEHVDETYRDGVLVQRVDLGMVARLYRRAERAGRLSGVIVCEPCGATLGTVTQDGAFTPSPERIGWLCARCHKARNLDQDDAVAQVREHVARHRSTSTDRLPPLRIPAR